MAYVFRWKSTLVIQLVLGSIILSCFPHPSCASDLKIRIDEILDEEISEELEQYDLNNDGILDEKEIEIGFREIQKALIRYEKQNAEDLGEAPLEDESKNSHDWKSVVAVTAVLGLVVSFLVFRCQRAASEQTRARNNAALLSQRDRWLASLSTNSGTSPANGSTHSPRREAPSATMVGGETQPNDQDQVQSPPKRSKTTKEGSNSNLDTSSDNSSSSLPMDTCPVDGSGDSIQIASDLKDVKLDSGSTTPSEQGEKAVDKGDGGSEASTKKVLEDSQKKAVAPKSSASQSASQPQTQSQPPSMTRDFAKVGDFLSKVFGCGVTVTEVTKMMHRESGQVYITYPELQPGLGGLVEKLCQKKSIGRDQVKVLVKLMAEMKALGPNYLDELVGNACTCAVKIVYPRLAKLVIEGGAVPEDDEDDLWSEFSSAGTNERADMLFGCLSGCFLDQDCQEMTVDMVKDLYDSLPEETSAEMLQHLFTAAGKKFSKLKRFDDLFSQPDLLALEKMLNTPSCAKAFAALLLHEVNQSKNKMGKYFQTTGLGSLLSISPMPRVGQTVHTVELMPQVAAVFESIPGWPQCSTAAILEKENAIRRGLERIQHLVQSGLSQVLRHKEDPSVKEAALAWMATILNLNQERMALSLASYMDHSITCGDGYMVNFCAILLHFFEPIFKPETRRLVDLRYCSSTACRLHYNLEMCMGGNQIVSENQELGPLPERLRGQHKFVTECYHLCQRAITVCVLPTLHLIDTVYRDISREIARVNDSAAKEKLQAKCSLLMQAFQAHVWEDKLVHRACLFYLAQSYLLLHLLQEREAKGDAGEQQLKAVFSHIPEFAIKDMAEWFSRLARTMPTLDRSHFSRLSFVPFVDLSVGLLEHGDLLLGPISASKIVRALLAFVKGDSRSQTRNWGHGVSSDLKCAVLACPSVQHQLCPALLHTYVSVDAVEGLDVDKESFDKYSSRLEIAELLQVLWERADCRESILSQCGRESFQQFLGAILDSLQHLLPDSLTRLSNVRKMEKEKENSAEWDRLSGRDQDKKEQFLRNEESTAKGFLSMAKMTLKFLVLVTGETRVAACFTRPPLSIRTASIMCDLIDSLCGQKSKNYNVKNKEKYGFNPSELVHWLMEVMVRILDQDTPGEHNFSECLAQAPGFELEHLQKAHSVLQEKGLLAEDALGQLGTYILMLQGLHENLEAESQTLAAEEWVADYLRLSIDKAALCQMYENRLQEARFYNAKIMSSHSYQANFQEMDPRSAKSKTLMKEMKQLKQNLPVNPSAAIFVVQDSDRMDVMRCLMSGPEDTPYSLGLFAFDVYFPSSYPSSPPLVKIITTGHGTVRFNPNLYADGKVCLSLLGTWHAADASEKWTPGTSSLYQILVSIQSMILTSHPVFNEPGHERLRETNGWEKHSREYNWKLHVNTVRYAMLGQLRNPPPGLEKVVRLHFALQKDTVLKQCAEWISDCQDSAMAKALQRDSDALRHELQALDPASISLEDEEDMDED